MQFFNRSLPLVALGLTIFQLAFAEVRLPKVFASHMVLQRRKPVPVWGWAEAGEKVTVTFSTQTKTVQTAPDGRWQVKLDPMEAGGPYQLTVRGNTNALTLDDVLLGEVWICSGQSNMEWRLAQVTNAPAEIASANYPRIRLFLVKKESSLTPKTDLDGTWSVCSPETAPNFTAVGYFFGRELTKELNVPIGLVNTSWGGTHSETWTSRNAMLRDPELSQVVASIPSDREALLRSGQERTMRLVKEKSSGVFPSLAEERTWARAEFDDHAWNKIGVSSDWEWRGLPTFDGVVWLRCEVQLPENARHQRLSLHLGAVDDGDSTYVNGQLVGATTGRTIARTYTLPDGLLKPGRNVIAVRVQDDGGSGGLLSTGLTLSGDHLDVPLPSEWKYRIAKAFPSSYEAGPNSYGTLLFNAMINPLIPLAMRGVIWYQGESNAGRAQQYRRTFPLLIEDWRQHWGQAEGGKNDFPFLFVQLANFNSAGGTSQRGSTWAELREAQTGALALPNTGMAVTADIGERNDIHPKNKQDVGKRLAAEALRIAYGQQRISAGPLFEGMKTEGNRAIISFKNTGSGLKAKENPSLLKGFEVAGSDQQFHVAKAEIRGNQVVVSAGAVAAPVAVRYGWADDNGEVNLYNREGYPACPFRTDSWKGITETLKFK